VNGYVVFRKCNRAKELGRACAPLIFPEFGEKAMCIIRFSRERKGLGIRDWGFVAAGLGRVSSYSPRRNSHIRPVLAQGTSGIPGNNGATKPNMAAKHRWPARATNNPRTTRHVTPGE
jgi:hypothetical protein